MNIQFKEIPYTSIASKKEESANTIREAGATVSKIEEKMINGTQCIVYEVSASGQNYLIAVVRVNSMYSAICEVVNADYTTYDYNALANAVAIAITAEKSSSTTNATTAPSSNSNRTTNIKINSTIDIDKIIE